MTEDNIKNFNEHRLIRALKNLSKDGDIMKFADWVNENVTEDFLSVDNKKPDK
jgi:hypothetical protein|tara:strand:- start:1146 stop:1304 length:159 start_codon:yes stop_codon:yes gene_type:complete